MYQKSKIVWFTGLSGSGKSTLSKIIKLRLLKKKYKILLIDGDVFRKKKNIKNKFTKKEIIQNNLKIIDYLKRIKRRYDFILVSVISPLKITRYKAHDYFKNRYYEIYIKCSMKTLVKRDTKGLYALAKKKIIKNLIGFNSKIKYQVSNYNKLVINTSKHNIAYCTKKIINHILK
jgi:adenylylsulfate kinase